MADQEPGTRRPRFVDTLRHGWKPGGRTEAAESSAEPTAAAGQSASGESGSRSSAPEWPAGAGAKPSGSKPPAPNLNERMEGLQGWMAEVERKQRRTTFFGTAALILALGAAGAALYLAITTPDSASKDDFDDLEAQVETLQSEVAESAQNENALKSAQASVQALEQRVVAAEQRASKNAAELAKVKAQAQAAQQAATAAQTAATTTPATTPATPGAKQQP
jgi:hypothetical protein